MPLAANSPARTPRRPAPTAKPVVTRTKPFTFRQLLVWVLASGAVGGLIYWMGMEQLKATRASGTFEISGVEIALLVSAVASLCWLVTRCWKYFDPYPDVRISPGAVPLGTSFDVEWTFRGSKGRLQGIAMRLEGREEVWAENKTKKEARPQKLTAPFYVEELQLPKIAKEGQVHVRLPEGLMPSFATDKTRITWLVRFENRIKWGPKLQYEFPVQVLPEVSRG